MSHSRRHCAALLVALVTGALAGCAGEPPPSCGEYALDEGESIPQEAVDCMSEAGVGGALRLVAPPNDQGYTIATIYTWQSSGGIMVTTQYVKDGGARFRTVCPDAVSVVDLGECERLLEGPENR